MLKRILLVSIFALTFLLGYSQLNINLLSNYTFPADRGELNDIWGYVDELNNEYALVGMENGVAIVDISVPTSPVEVFYAPGPRSGWRDVKVWKDYAYITNESSGGLMIIDMTKLPGGTITSNDVSSYSGSAYPFTRAHNIYIDENGVGYIVGADNGIGGAIMLDLDASPLNPTELGQYDEYYIHDLMVRGDTMWGGAVNDGFFVVIDVSNKSAPVTMATQNTPNFFSHNCWISDDGNYLFTTDEKRDSYVAAYDVSDLSNITEVDRIQSSPGSEVIPHNVFYLNGYAITSYYRDGVTIHDVSDPSNMVEVGNYDTSPTNSGNGFNGCWGVYPYLPSGRIIASDIENGLFVLGPTYVPGAYLVGNVTDSMTTANLDGVKVDIATTNVSANTNILGNYKSGYGVPGTYDITYTKYSYKSKTIKNVNLIANSTVTLDVELVPLTTFDFKGQVIEALTSNPIQGANVRITNDSFTTTIQTDASGNFSIPNLLEGDYSVYIAKWGYGSICINSTYLSLTTNPHIYKLDTKYYDDFTFDLGWTVSGDAVAGLWERGVPEGTIYDSQPSNSDSDVNTDCEDKAYVTGNAGGDAWTDDVDDGSTILTSPNIDLASYTNPHINFSRWFFNDGGNGTPDDSLVITLTNGVITSIIDGVDRNDQDISIWSSKSIRVLDYMTLSNTMKFTVRVVDRNSGHIVEGGIDQFEIIDLFPVGIDNVSKKDILLIYPNPFNDELTIEIKDNTITNVKVEVFEVTGKLIETKIFNNDSPIYFTNNYKSGIYYVNVYGDNNLIETQKLIKF